ncbi:MAG: hypothetical protein JXA94_05135, partial [Parachlamydiales bacterium]|nr:hypothetical protein [Parachlamydiales bacterium]
MKRLSSIIFFILIFILKNNYFIFSAKKPKIVTGINSSGYYKKLEENEDIYPSSLKDNLFFSIEEELFSFFKFRHRVDFYNSHYNYYSENLEKLKSYNLNNSLTLFFYIKKPNEIKLMTRPIIYYKYGEV